MATARIQSHQALAVDRGRKVRIDA
jgi:hypothetical protein